MNIETKFFAVVRFSGGGDIECLIDLDFFNEHVNNDEDDKIFIAWYETWLTKKISDHEYILLEYIDINGIKENSYQSFTINKKTSNNDMLFFENWTKNEHDQKEIDFFNNLDHL